MDPATPDQSEFFRVHVGSAKIFQGALAWVQVAKDPMPARESKAYVFRHLSLTDTREMAAIYPATAAAAVISVLQSTYPAAQLEAATFEDWILSEAGPGK